MHIRLYFVCFLFVFSSCSNNQVSVKNEKEGKLNSTYQLMVSDEKKIGSRALRHQQDHIYANLYRFYRQSLIDLPKFI